MDNDRAKDIILMALDNLALDIMHDSDAHNVTEAELDEVSMKAMELIK